MKEIVFNFSFETVHTFGTWPSHEGMTFELTLLYRNWPNASCLYQIET